MIAPLIIIGLIGIILFAFILAASIKALQWYKYYRENPQKKCGKAEDLLKIEESLSKEEKELAAKAPADGWYVFTALAAFVGVTFLAFIPILAWIFAFIMLLTMWNIKARGEKSGIASFTIWSVIITAGALTLVSLGLFFWGLAGTAPAALEPAKEGGSVVGGEGANKSTEAKKASALAQLFAMLRAPKSIEDAQAKEGATAGGAAAAAQQQKMQ